MQTRILSQAAHPVQSAVFIELHRLLGSPDCVYYADGVKNFFRPKGPVAIKSRQSMQLAFLPDGIDDNGAQYIRSGEDTHNYLARVFKGTMRILKCLDLKPCSEYRHWRHEDVPLPSGMFLNCQTAGRY